MQLTQTCLTENCKIILIRKTFVIFLSIFVYTTRNTMNNIHKFLLSAGAALAMSCVAIAVEPTDDILRLASNYYAYPYTDQPAPELTAAPAGYEPFHIEHYGRHGSRWLIGRWAYERPVALLEPAERAGKLTPRGKELLAELRDICERSKGRDGELTPLGARQHRGIAKRMFANFPEIFVDGAPVVARSTVVIRCILSMDNELQELKAANPKLDIRSDASWTDMYYMNGWDSDTVCHKFTSLWDAEYKTFYESKANSGDYLKAIVTDLQWAKDSLEVQELFNRLFEFTANAQSHDDIYAPWDIFSKEEVTKRWEQNNAAWFQRMGKSSKTKGMAPYTQAKLLRNFIASADTAVATQRPSANLRFGHEVCVMPMAILMELGHYGQEINDFNQVAARWKDYEIFPMGSNIQLIFYRSTSSNGPVLVKALLNEREMELPAQPIANDLPYYKWDDVRAYWQSKLTD